MSWDLGEVLLWSLRPSTRLPMVPVPRAVAFRLAWDQEWERQYRLLLCGTKSPSICAFPHASSRHPLVPSLVASYILGSCQRYPHWLRYRSGVPILWYHRHLSVG